MSAPAATANVIASWKLMPHSAWCAASSVSGVALAYGRTWRSIAASSYQPFARATKKPVWLVFGVQSSASRTLAGSCGALGATLSGAAEDAVGLPAPPDGDWLWPPPQAATNSDATMMAAIGVRMFTLTRVLGEGRRLPAGYEKRRPGIRATSSQESCFLRWYEPDQVLRVCGRATLSAHTRSPEAVFSCPRSYHSGRRTPAWTAATRRSRRRPRGLPARCGPRGGDRAGRVG